MECKGKNNYITLPRFYRLSKISVVFMAQTKEMTAGRVFPLLFSFTLPLLLGNLLQQTYSLIDAAIVGKYLGIHALASVGASTSVVFLILGFCNG